MKQRTISDHEDVVTNIVQKYVDNICKYPHDSIIHITNLMNYDSKSTLLEFMSMVNQLIQEDAREENYN